MVRLIPQLFQVAAGLSLVAVVTGAGFEYADVLDLDTSVKAVEKSALPSLVLTRATTALQYCRATSETPVIDSIVHQQVFERADGSLFVQHMDIVQNGERCGSNSSDHLNIYPSHLLMNSSIAEIAGVADVYSALRAEPWASLTFDRIAGDNAARGLRDPFFVGFDTVARVCGNETAWPANTFHLFVDTFLRFQDPSLGFIARYNGVTETGLAIFKPRQGVCLFKNAISRTTGAALPPPTSGPGAVVPSPRPVREAADSAKGISSDAAPIRPGQSGQPSDRNQSRPSANGPPRPGVPVDSAVIVMQLDTPLYVPLPGGYFVDGLPRPIVTSLIEIGDLCPNIPQDIVSNQFPGVETVPDDLPDDLTSTAPPAFDPSQSQPSANGPPQSDAPNTAIIIVQLDTQLQVSLPGNVFVDGQARVITVSLLEIGNLCPSLFQEVVSSQFPGVETVAEPIGGLLPPVGDDSVPTAPPVPPQGGQQLPPPTSQPPAPINETQPAFEPSVPATQSPSTGSQTPTQFPESASRPPTESAPLPPSSTPPQDPSEPDVVTLPPDTPQNTPVTVPQVPTSPSTALPVTTAPTTGVPGTTTIADGAQDVPVTTAPTTGVPGTTTIADGTQDVFDIDVGDAPTTGPATVSGTENEDRDITIPAPTAAPETTEVPLASSTTIGAPETTQAPTAVTTVAPETSTTLVEETVQVPPVVTIATTTSEAELEVINFTPPPEAAAPPTIAPTTSQAITSDLVVVDVTSPPNTTAPTTSQAADLVVDNVTVPPSTATSTTSEENVSDLVIVDTSTPPSTSGFAPTTGAPIPTQTPTTAAPPPTTTAEPIFNTVAVPPTEVTTDPPTTAPPVPTTAATIDVGGGGSTGGGGGGDGGGTFVFDIDP